MTGSSKAARKSDACRRVISAFVILFSLLSASLAAEAASPSEEASASGVRSETEAGTKALDKGEADAAVDHFMEAYRLGMSEDSLCYYLAEAALARSAYDTAMAFNLTIRPPEAGPFREAVLEQRYRLYVKSGLASDAENLTDSLHALPGPKPAHGRSFHFRLASGYLREDNLSARNYPFGEELGRYTFSGFHFRNQASLLWPLFSTGTLPWSSGVEYEAVKSYAKDSLDYRTGVKVQVEALPLGSLTLAATAGIGKIAGTGMVSTYKLESSLLSLSGTGISLFQAGVESEWTGGWERRFEGFWAFFYRDLSIGTGKGFSYSLTLSGIRVPPIRDEVEQRVMYVDDVAKAKPVHFTDAAFRDTIKAGIAAFQQYQAKTGTRAFSILSPQGFLMAMPSLGYSFPLPLQGILELNATYSLSYFPAAYSWWEGPAPAPTPAGQSDFRGLAFNRADGREYAAVLIQENAGFREYYGPAPIVTVRKHRIDNEVGGNLTLQRGFAGWGTLSLNMAAARNWTTLRGVSPIWIPAWDFGAVLKWNRTWNW